MNAESDIKERGLELVKNFLSQKCIFRYLRTNLGRSTFTRFVVEMSGSDQRTRQISNIFSVRNAWLFTCCNQGPVRAPDADVVADETDHHRVLPELSGVLLHEGSRYLLLLFLSTTTATLHIILVFLLLLMLLQNFHCKTFL